MRYQITNVQIVLPDRVIPEGVCCFTDGVIDYVGTQPQPDAHTLLRGNGQWLLPGFVDIHCHGGDGLHFMDATPEQMEQIAPLHMAHGTTTMLATTMTHRWPARYEVLDRFGQLVDSGRLLTLHGVHLEGPWLNPAQCGAQDVQRMELPDPDRLQELLARYPFIERVSAAPELPGGLDLGTQGQQSGLVMSVAHTDADFDTILQAADRGYTLVTHLYSGMSLTHREHAYRIAGGVEGALYDDRLFVELIADGKHLPISLLKLVCKCKGTDRVCLVTDAMRAAGMSDGTLTRLGALADGLDVLVEDGVAKVPDRTGFAGSVATTDRLLRVMHRDAGFPLSQVSQMLSTVPAQVMGYEDRGSIHLGKRADFVLLNSDLQVESVILEGNLS